VQVSLCWLPCCVLLVIDQQIGEGDKVGVVWVVFVIEDFAKGAHPLGAADVAEGLQTATSGHDSSSGSARASIVVGKNPSTRISVIAPAAMARRSISRCSPPSVSWDNTRMYGRVSPAARRS